MAIVLEFPWERIYFIALKSLLFFFVLFLTWFMGRAVRFLVGRVLRKAIPHFYANLQEYVKWIVWLLGLLVALSTLGLSEEILLLAILLMGIAALVASRDSLQNFFSRPFLDLYADFKVGDWIKIGRVVGRVIEINSMNTILITKKGNMAVVPNYLFLREMVINESHQTGYEITVPIVVETSVDEIVLEKEVLVLVAGVRKYLKPGVNPSVVTIKTDEKSKELALIVMLKDREHKALVMKTINDGIKRILDRLSETEGGS